MLTGVIWTVGTLAGLFVLLTGFHATWVKIKGRALGDLSSNFWLALILIGAVLAALGNINFNVARDREKGERASAKAMGMLRPEIERNLVRVAGIRAGIDKGSSPTASLETTAWNVVSTGGLLSQMDENTLGEVANTYHLVAQAETYRSEIISRRIGIASALMEAEAVTNQYVQFLRRTLDQLEPKLRALLEKPTK